MYWLQFLISATVIVFAGIRLTTFADKLSDELHLGKMWIGIVLLGFVTSLPEAITSLVSVISLNAIDLAVGNLLGSNNFNPLLIVVMDLFYRKGSVTNAIHPDQSHKVSARFAALLTFVVVIDIFIHAINPSLHIGPLSIGSFLIVVLYFAGMKKLAGLSSEQSTIAPIQQQGAQRNGSLTKIWVWLAVNAILVIGASMWLAQSADIIAERTGLGETFFGSIFLAFVTSLPEMVVTLSALKLGSLDLAIGNIFGSNMTNIFILFICSLFYKGGAILGAVSSAHIITAALSIILTFVAIKGILTRNKKTVFGLGWDSLIMLPLFILGMSILYGLRP